MPFFLDPAGVAVPAVTADQMREIDRIAVEETGPSLPQMMENAGRNLAFHVMTFLGSDWRQLPISILAGSGGNGGGGICAGRHLANRGGNVVVVLSQEGRMTGVPSQQLDVYRHAGGQVLDPDALLSRDTALIVDALVGYSLRGAPRGPVMDLIAWTNDTDIPVVSLDVPSGVDATTGEAPGQRVAPTATVTLALPKTGLDLSAGTLWLADLGIPRETYRRARLEVSGDLFGDRFLIELHMGSISR